MPDAVPRFTRTLAVAVLLSAVPATGRADTLIVEGGSLPLPRSSGSAARVLSRADCAPGARSTVSRPARPKAGQRVGRILLRDTEQKV